MRINYLMISVVALAALGPGAKPVYAQINPDTVVGTWHFDEGAGSVAEDASGNGNHGILHGPQWSGEGKFAGAVKFDGITDYIEFAQSERFKIPQFTVMAWFNTRTLDKYGHIVQTGRDWNDMAGYVLRVHKSGVVQAGLAFGPGNTTTFVTGPAIEAHTWYHLTLTYDGVTATLHLNGEPVSSRAGAGQGVIVYDDSPVRIGTHSTDTGAAFDGHIDEVALFNEALPAHDIDTLMNQGLAPPAGPSHEAFDPIPANGQSDVSPDTLLSWSPGVSAATHTLYFGTDREVVQNATIAEPQAVLVAPGLTDTVYDPGPLAFDQTYYWRVDEVNAGPGHTVFPGPVWQFTVMPQPVPITQITATASSARPDMQPENTINGSGLDAQDLHSNVPTDMWHTFGGGPWIQYAFDRIYRVYELLIWNSNQPVEPFIGFGAETLNVEYSLDGQTWLTLNGPIHVDQASGRPGNPVNATVDMQGVMAKYVKLSLVRAYGNMGQWGLSEVRFLALPVRARDPVPAHDATVAGLDVRLGWRSDGDAVTYAVALSTDRDALVNGTAPLWTVSEPHCRVEMLDYGATYHWQVTEFEAAGEPSAHAGPIWRFHTPALGMIDDFESYRADEGHEVFLTWVDGFFGGNEALGGSLVGYIDAPYVETTIVHSGRQSMPLHYDNNGLNYAVDCGGAHLDCETGPPPTYSEARRAFEGLDLTQGNAQVLALSFRGPASDAARRARRDIAMPGDALPDPLYLVLEDDTGEAVTVRHPDPLAVWASTWQDWRIPLTEFASLRLDSIRAIRIGVGYRDGSQPGGEGVLYIDDLRVGTPGP